MPVNGFKSVRMTNYDIVTVTFSFVIHDTYFSTKRRTYGIPNVHLDVKPFMLTTKTCTITVIRSNSRTRRRHAEMPQVYLVFFRQFYIITMGILVVPIGIKTKRGIFKLFVTNQTLQGNRIHSSHLFVDRCLASQQVLPCNRHTQHGQHNDRSCLKSSEVKKHLIIIIKFAYLIL